MVYESAPWRTEIKKHALTLRDAPQWPIEGVPFDIEKALLYSAVVLRKLIEDKKVADEFGKMEIELSTLIASAPPRKSVWRNTPGSVDFDWESEKKKVIAH
jgi:hypothetical protein